MFGVLKLRTALLAATAVVALGSQSVAQETAQTAQPAEAKSETPAAR